MEFTGEYLNGKEWNGIGYDINNNISYELKNGNGSIKKYYRSGELRFEGAYINGLKNGKGKDYYDNGEIEFEGEYLDGKRWNGKQYDIDDKNKIFEIKNGKGYLKEYHNYRLIFEGEYEEGIRNGKGIEYDYESFYLDIKAEGEYLKGQKNGKWKEYYCEIIEEADEYDEESVETTTNFILKYEGEYLNDQRIGKGKEYNEEKQLIFEGEYLYNRKLKGKTFVENILEFEGEYLNEKNGMVKDMIDLEILYMYWLKEMVKLMNIMRMV